MLETDELKTYMEMTNMILDPRERYYTEKRMKEALDLFTQKLLDE